MKSAFYGLQQENSYFFHVPAIQQFHFSKGERTSRRRRRQPVAQPGDTLGLSISRLTGPRASSACLQGWAAPHERLQTAEAWVHRLSRGGLISRDVGFLQLLLGSVWFGIANCTYGAERGGFSFHDAPGEVKL